VLDWANQLADALSFLHSQQPPILHRDIKPSNLKITPSGLLKLVDFGLVKLLAPEDMTITILQGRGTALYTPLEQYGGDTGHTGVQSDIYSFGATLYHLMTNKPPLEARERFLNPGHLEPIRSINPQISARTERAVLWAMNLHPADRPPSVEAFQKALMGDTTPITRPRTSYREPTPTFSDLVTGRPEMFLLAAIAILAVLSLALTLMNF
jgi:serine/threonine-protein kinase